MWNTDNCHEIQNDKCEDNIPQNKANFQSKINTLMLVLTHIQIVMFI